LSLEDRKKNKIFWLIKWEQERSCKCLKKVCIFLDVVTVFGTQRGTSTDKERNLRHIYTKILCWFYKNRFKTSKQELKNHQYYTGTALQLITKEFRRLRNFTFTVRYYPALLLRIFYGVCNQYLYTVEVSYRKPIFHFAKIFVFAKNFASILIFSKIFVIFVTFRKLFSRKATKFSRKYENENFRFNPTPTSSANCAISSSASLSEV
jgi:hypothetical protein